MIFNEKIRLLRKKLGLTQEKFAKAVGVSRQSVYKWEDGQSYPEIPKVLRMKELFREFAVSIDDLFDDNMSVSDSGFLKTNEEVEYENAHRKVRKVRKDKGIKTGIPPHYKDGTPVVRRKKKPVEEPAPAVTPEYTAPAVATVEKIEKVETPAAVSQPITVVVNMPAATPAPTTETPATDAETSVKAPAAEPAPVAEPAPAEPARPHTPSFRTRAAAPSFSHRDAQASAMAAINARRAKAAASLLDDDDSLLGDIDLKKK